MAIGRELGLFTEGDLCLSSNELADFVRLHRWADIRRVTIFARVSPEDKLTIVRALQDAGHYVGMAGDGINDAPALKASDIGVAIGAKSADVAKEASDLIVTDGNYNTIPAAVREGRQIYFNIRRAVAYLLLCSFSTIGVMIVSVVSNLPLALTPLQILWLNLAVHIFPGIALAFVKAEPNLMNQKPRHPKERLLPWRSMVWVTVKSIVVTCTAIWAYASEQSTGHLVHAQTIVMTTLAFALLFQMFSGLSDSQSIFRMRESLSWTFWLAFSGGITVQITAIQWPWLSQILGTTSLSLSELLWVLFLSLGNLLIVEILKIWATKSAFILRPKLSN
jgi:Ca2+-transporting ATPase